MTVAFTIGVTSLAALLIGTSLGSTTRKPHGAEPTNPRVHRCGRRRRRSADLDEHFADAVDLVLLAVRCGHLPLQAMRVVGPRLAPGVRTAFEQVDAAARSGRRFADALEALPAALGDRAHALADAFATADRDGLPLAPVLERLAAEARHDRRRRSDARSRQLPVRLAFPLVLCTLPSFVLLAVAPLLLAALHTIRR